MPGGRRLSPRRRSSARGWPRPPSAPPATAPGAGSRPGRRGRRRCWRSRPRCPAGPGQPWPASRDGTEMASRGGAENADATDAKLNSDPMENADISEPSEANEPMDSSEPAEPIDSTDPAEPMDRIEPVEPIDRMDPEEPMLRSEPALVAWPGCFAMRALCNASRVGRNVGGADRTGA